MKQQTMWCQKYQSGMFTDFSPCVKTCRMHGEGQIFEVIVGALEAEVPGCCWAWWNFEQQRLTMVYPFRQALNMCFPYGPEIEERQGRGRVTPVSVEVVQEVN
jgi:hypothetical protein